MCIKRVLWVEDNPENEAKELFVQNSESGETEVIVKEDVRIINTLDKALKEFSSPRLYNYDTIVLDIDFEQGIFNRDEVYDTLMQSGGIYLPNDWDEKRFLERFGGYLLYLYLLIKGYPREQVAFLTGNADMIQALKRYTGDVNNLEKWEPEQISAEFERIWKKIIDENTDIDENRKAFQKKVNELKIEKKYKERANTWLQLYHQNNGDVSKCIDLLKKTAEAINNSKILEEVQPDTANTSTIILEHFHEANLEPPPFFSKLESNPIKNHSLKDAEHWLNSRRSPDNVTRWLMLYAGDYVKQMSNLSSQVRAVFDTRGIPRNPGDGGVLSAFRQMYFLFDGLKSKNRGLYYQAVAAIAMPYGNKLNTNNETKKNCQLQKLFARFAKQARNYCAHNYFGDEISNETTLFLTMGIMCAIRNEYIGLENWFKNAKKIVCSRNVGISPLADQQICNKIIEIKDKLINKYIDTNKCNPISGDVDAFKLVQIMGFITNRESQRLFGNNPTVDADVVSAQERYYRFTLAAYVVKAMTDWRRNNSLPAEMVEIQLMLDVARQIFTQDYIYYDNIS